VRCDSGYVPRIDRIEDRWYWRYDDPDDAACGNDLRYLSRRDERLLGKTALSLWMELERERGWTACWFDGKAPENRTLGTRLRDFAERLGLTQWTASHALQRLRDCGLVQTVRVQDPTWPYYLNSLRFRVWGTWEVRKGKRRVLAPPTFFQWALGRGSWGGDRRSRSHDAVRQAARRATRDQGVSDQDHISRSRSLKSRVFSQEREDCASADLGTVRSFFGIPGVKGEQQAAPLLMIVKDPPATEQPGASCDFYSLIRDQLMRAPKLVPLPPRTEPLPPLDPLPQEPNGSPPLAPNMGDIYYVGHLAAAYRSAVQAIYGVRDFTMTKGEIKKSRYFPMLVEAATFLVEHEIPPASWAEWCVNKAHEQGRPKPPLALVFNPGLLKKRHGWFSHEAGSRGYSVKIARPYMEQMHRRQEAQNLQRGMTPEGALMSSPVWYAEMREEERKMGHADPIDLYPRIRRAG
jgi:hypothetical protein